MLPKEIIASRLYNQQISCTLFKEPAELISWMGGIQAQDYPNSKWAIGVRIPGITDEEVEQALASGRIVRTWLMRGTWQIVTAHDVHWLLDLLGQKIIAACATRYRHLDLDEKILKKADEVLTDALQGEKHLTRDELARVLAKKGILATGIRLAHILQHAALNKIICFGTKRGNELTSRLLNENSSPGKLMDRGNALCEIARRYFLSRGPATIYDFAWWSGLTITDAKQGIELAKPFLRQETIEDKTYWMGADMQVFELKKRMVYLLPAYDEYLVGYTDRSMVLEGDNIKNVITNNGIFTPSIIVNGKVAGTWKRTVKKDCVVVEIKPFALLSLTTQKLLRSSAIHFSKFLNKSLQYVNTKAFS